MDNRTVKYDWVDLISIVFRQVQIITVINITPNDRSAIAFKHSATVPLPVSQNRSFDDDDAYITCEFVYGQSNPSDRERETIWNHERQMRSHISWFVGWMLVWMIPPSAFLFSHLQRNITLDILNEMNEQGMNVLETTVYVHGSFLTLHDFPGTTNVYISLSIQGVRPRSYVFYDREMSVTSNLDGSSRPHMKNRERNSSSCDYVITWLRD